MKPVLSNAAPSVLLTCLIFTIVTARSAVTIVDTFDQGGFSISLPEVNDNEETVNLPLGERRIAHHSFSAIGTLSEMSRTLDPVAGTLSFRIVSTAPQPNFPFGLGLAYVGPTLRNIANCSEFILGFSQFSGVGTLYIELGGSLGLEGVTRVALTGPGEVRYPVSSVYAGVGHTLEAFNVLNFRFESRSPEFSFTLDEIRLIPEPSSALLALAGGSALLWRRRRP